MDVVNPHNRIDGVPLTTSTLDLEEDPVAAYLGYYDFYMASDVGVTYSFV
jgi:hypothetical protein